MSIIKKYEVIEKKLAKERQKEHGNTAPGKPKTVVENFPQVNMGKSRDHIGKNV